MHDRLSSSLDPKVILVVRLDIFLKPWEIYSACILRRFDMLHTRGFVKSWGRIDPLDMWKPLELVLGTTLNTRSWFPYMH